MGWLSDCVTAVVSPYTPLDLQLPNNGQTIKHLTPSKWGTLQSCCTAQKGPGAAFTAKFKSTTPQPSTHNIV